MLGDFLKRFDAFFYFTKCILGVFSLAWTFPFLKISLPGWDPKRYKY